MEEGRPRRAVLPAALLVPLLLTVVWVICYWPGQPAFAADDYVALRYASDLGRCAADLTGPQYGVGFFTFHRPLITLSFGIEQALFGPAPTGYFLVNALALLAGSLALAATLRGLFPKRALLAFLVPLLWLLHPNPARLHAAWAVARTDAFASAFVLIALWLHLRYRRGGRRWPVFMAASCALLTKESAAGLPLLALAIDLVDRGPTHAARLRLRGHDLHAWPYLLLLPVWFGLRIASLGRPLGGYRYLDLVPARPGAIAEAFVDGVSESLVPLAAPWIRACAFAVILLAALAWAARRDRTARLLAIALATAALWGPIAPLLPLMQHGSEQRMAYLPCVLVLFAWAATAVRLGRGRVIATTIVTLLPLASLLPARDHALVEAASRKHFNQALVDAMHTCDRILPPDLPVVLTGDTARVHEQFSFMWGLGSVLKPPFTKAPREVVSLHPLVPIVDVPDVLVTGALPAWVEVGATGATVKRNPATALVRAEPRGFSGRVGTALLDRKRGEPKGFDLGKTSRVAVLTTRGSLLVGATGWLGIGDLLGGNAYGPFSRNADFRSGLALLAARLGSKPLWFADVPYPVVSDLVWEALDLASDSPLYLLWRTDSGSHIATLRFDRGWAAAYAKRRWQ